MTTRLVKPKLLVGEGKDEEGFFGALLDHLGVTDVEPVAYGGKTKLEGRALEELTRASGFRDRVGLGVTRDADDDFDGAVRSIQAALARAGLPVPNAHGGFAAAGALRVGIFVLPRANTKGALEDLCLAACEAPVLACVDAFVACAKGAGRKIPQENKSRARAYLATLDDPELRVGQAAAKGLWDFAHPAFEELRVFVRAL